MEKLALLVQCQQPPVQPAHKERQVQLEKMGQMAPTEKMEKMG